MKNILLYYICGVTLLACSKTHEPAGTASLTLINTVVGSSPLAVNFSEQDSITYYYNGLQILYNNFNTIYQLNSYSGVQHLRLYSYPDTGRKATPLYDLTLDLPIGSIHTLFLTGTVASPDTLFTTDVLPYHPASDSSISIRFVNLSPGSTPVRVDVSGQTVVESLPYKGLTSFTAYPANASTTSYTLEFRDEVSGNLLGSYTMNGLNNNSGNNTQNNTDRYHDFTLALTGVTGGTGSNAQSTLLITE